MRRWPWLLGAVMLLGVCQAAAGTNAFDLNVQLALPAEMRSLLQEGDILRAILRPEVQYGARSAPGQPVVLEKAWAGGELPPMRFAKALEPDQIYRLELQIVRAGSAREVRYVSATDKLPLRSVEQWLPMRLHRAGPRDQRENHVMLVSDGRGVLRVMLFAA
ncbi:MAG: hypothetical protein KBD01_03645 [Acidobacteria bacterium]|nr:hypothetical protein [Acidobacteriota bacterium]